MPKCADLYEQAVERVLAPRCIQKREDTYNSRHFVEPTRISRNARLWYFDFVFESGGWASSCSGSLGPNSLDLLFGYLSMIQIEVPNLLFFSSDWIFKARPHWLFFLLNHNVLCFISTLKANFSSSIALYFYSGRVTVYPWKLKGCVSSNIKNLHRLKPQNI